MSTANRPRAGFHSVTPRIVVTDVDGQVQFYIYVDEPDRVYQRALGAGATALEAPRDTPYGDRRAMVRDPFGNVFQIACQIRH